MKILLATDGSPCSKAAVAELCSRAWPAGTEVKVLAVAHTRFPEIYDPAFALAAVHYDMLAEERKRATQWAESAAARIREKAPGLSVTAEVQEGRPKALIVEEAAKWGADLVVLGSHGYGPAHRFLLGSVSHAVVLHAPCSVHVVRPPPAAQARPGS